jgi:hypothetical protein
MYEFRIFNNHYHSNRIIADHDIGITWEIQIS